MSFHVARLRLPSAARSHLVTSSHSKTLLEEVSRSWAQQLRGIKTPHAAEDGWLVASARCAASSPTWAYYMTRPPCLRHPSSDARAAPADQWCPPTRLRQTVCAGHRCGSCFAHPLYELSPSQAPCDQCDHVRSSQRRDRQCVRAGAARAAARAAPPRAGTQLSCQLPSARCCARPELPCGDSSNTNTMCRSVAFHTCPSAP